MNELKNLEMGIEQGQSLANHLGIKSCACGCGEEFEINWDSHKKRYTHFIRGHHFRGKNHTEETKKKISKLNKGNHYSSKTEFKKGHSLGKGIPLTEEHKKNLSETIKRLFKEGILKPNMLGKHISEERKQSMRKPRSLELKKLISEKTKEAMQRPDIVTKFTEERIKKMILNLQKRPTSYEKELEATLNRIQPNEWKYTGDGSFIIGYKNPDFVNCNGRKIIIEVYSNYYKEKTYGSEENYKQKRAAHFAKYGYQTIFLNENEYANEEIVREKLWRREWS